MKRWNRQDYLLFLLEPSFFFLLEQFLFFAGTGVFYATSGWLFCSNRLLEFLFCYNRHEESFNREKKHQPERLGKSLDPVRTGAARTASRRGFKVNGTGSHGGLREWGEICYRFSFLFCFGFRWKPRSVFLRSNSANVFCLASFSERFRSVDLCSERSLFSLFLFFLISARDLSVMFSLQISPCLSIDHYFLLVSRN